MPRASAARRPASSTSGSSPASGFTARDRGFAVSQRNVAPSPDAKGFGHDFGAVRVARAPSPEPSGPPVIQRWAWLKRKLGIGHEWDTERRGLLSGGVGTHHWGEVFGPPQVASSAHKAIETPVPSDVETGLSLVSKAGSGAQGVARGAEYMRVTDQTPTWASGVGVGANALSAVGSTVEAGLKTHQILTGSQKKKDKALTGLGAISDLGNATISGANAARSIPGVGSGVGAMASTIAGPAALVTGAADVLGGSLSAGLAAHRQGKLAELQERHGNYDDGAELATAGAARFAKEAQKTRKYRGIGTALKGGLAVAGGAALLAGAGPVGWGLLAGAAVAGGAASLYRKWRKHRIGTKILNNPAWRIQLQDAGVTIPTLDDLAGQSRLKRWNPLNTKESRAYDLMRGQLGVSLTRSGDNDFSERNKASILDLMGIKKKRGRAKDVAAALEG